ncbi:MAG: zinc-binding dehydrogenase [Pyrodictiaceae archaeon]
MVKAAVLEEFGKPFKIADVDLKPLSSDWVEVEVKAVGICGRDVVVWRGGFRSLRPPLILGHEVFGLYEGRPVAVYPAIVTDKNCLKYMEGRENLCEGYLILGESVPGGYAEKVYVPQWNLIELSEASFEKYAAAACGVATFIHAARKAGISGGSKVLVTGASGGVAVHGIQFLVSMGVEVYAATRSEEKARLLEKLGATPVIAQKGFGAELARSHGRVDAVFEVAGAPTINESLRALKPGGTLVLIGNVEGQPIVLERPALTVMREHHIVGSAAYTKREYASAIRIIEKGLIKPFYKTYKLNEVNKAYEDIVAGRLVGRAILKP